MTDPFSASPFSAARRTGRGGGTAGAWARGGPIDGVLPVSSVLVDAGEASGLDLAAAGFAQWFAGRDGAAAPAGPGEWLVAIPTPYDVEVLPRTEFAPALLQQPAVLAGSFPDPHPPGWIEQVTSNGIAVIVVPGLTELDGFVDLEILRSAWCVLAPAVRRR